MKTTTSRPQNLWIRSRIMPFKLSFDVNLATNRKMIWGEMNSRCFQIIQSQQFRTLQGLTGSLAGGEGRPGVVYDKEKKTIDVNVSDHQGLANLFGVLSFLEYIEARLWLTKNRVVLRLTNYIIAFKSITFILVQGNMQEEISQWTGLGSSCLVTMAQEIVSS